MEVEKVFCKIVNEIILREKAKLIEEAREEMDKEKSRLKEELEKLKKGYSAVRENIELLMLEYDGRPYSIDLLLREEETREFLKYRDIRVGVLVPHNVQLRQYISAGYIRINPRDSRESVIGKAIAQIERRIAEIEDELQNLNLTDFIDSSRAKELLKTQDAYKNVCE